MIAVEARNAVKAFGQGALAVRALDDVSVAINQGEFFTLLGPSGCGKTTLLRLIAGFETPTSGTILLDGADITDLPPNRRPVNTVFQSYALFPHLTVAQNIAFGLEMLGRPRAEVAARVSQMLALVKLEAMARRKVSQLSGGQQQRVALARALAPAPKVLLLDEPLSALDLQLRKEMQVELKRLQVETGITFVFVTHDQEEALTMSDRIGVMSAGKLQQVGSPRDIYTRPLNRFVASFIGETNFLEGQTVPGGVRLGCGAVVEAVGAKAGAVTLTVRPEHVRIEGAEAGGVPAVVTSLVYFGTDTHCHLV
ncbi:MAG: ABC transporter ATP-binding protein, partial [Paracoccaceae bacterium]